MLVRTSETVTRAYKEDNAANRCASLDRMFGVDPRTGNFAKDEQLFRESDPARDAYQVVTGAVRGYKLLSDGRCQIIAFYLPGDIFGISTSDVHLMTAEAIVETTVRTASLGKIDRIAVTDANLSRELWNLMATQLQHAENHLLLLGRKTALERVASFLIEMDDRMPGGGEIPLPMCRRDVGDYLGLTLETVSRVLSELHAKKTIEFSGDARRHIVLRNRARLRTIEFSTHLN